MTCPCGREKCTFEYPTPDADLPGMWERADFEGGQTDDRRPSPCCPGFFVTWDRNGGQWEPCPGCQY